MSKTSTLRATLAHAKSKNRAAFIPYITAGDPNLGTTAIFVKTLVNAGADIIELGVPFSDPVADGPTNQAAATRGLASGTTLEKVLALVKQLRVDKIKTPIVIFTYLNPVYQMGIELFASKAAASGVTGVLLVDLPPELAAPTDKTIGFYQNYGAVMKEHGIETVFLASPTTAPDRLNLIDSSSTGFIYYISRTGVTGTQTSLPTNLVQELEDLRKLVKNPIAVGFGISTPEQARQLSNHADAIVVGSALVKIIESANLSLSDQGVGNETEQIKRVTKELDRVTRSFLSG